MAVLANDISAPADLREKSLLLAARVIECDPAVRGGAGYERARQLLESGAAMTSMQKIIETVGAGLCACAGPASCGRPRACRRRRRLGRLLADRSACAPRSARRLIAARVSTSSNGSVTGWRRVNRSSHLFGRRIPLRLCRRGSRAIQRLRTRKHRHPGESTSMMSAAVYLCARAGHLPPSLLPRWPRSTNGLNPTLFRTARAASAYLPQCGTAFVYCPLDRPNGKLTELMLAADAFRRGGTRRLVLIAPYLCYMRQDKAFHEERRSASRPSRASSLSSTGY